MCEVEKPLVFASCAPKLEKDGLKNQKKIEEAGKESQNEQQWKALNNQHECGTYNMGLYACAKAFFSRKKHSKAYFVPYFATVNHEKFTDPDRLPIDYFYRLLITQSQAVKNVNKIYSSRWSPDKTNGLLDIWDSKNICFHIVLYGFLEVLLDTDESEILEIKDLSQKQLTLRYNTIKLHNSAFIYWLEIPKNAKQYADPHE